MKAVNGSTMNPNPYESPIWATVIEEKPPKPRLAWYVIRPTVALIVLGIPTLWCVFSVMTALFLRNN